jgi:uncharacterized protein (DUF2384 family)
MKKRKKYSAKEKSSKVKEPLVLSSLPLLSVLYNMSFHEVSDAHLSGEKLLEVQEQTSLGAQELAGIVGVSKSKYYELLQMDDIGPKNIDALADFAALWQKGVGAFDDDTALLNEWLETRNINLGNIKPRELLSSRVGRRELEKAFFRIEYSTYG